MSDEMTDSVVTAKTAERGTERTFARGPRIEDSLDGEGSSSGSADSFDEVKERVIPQSVLDKIDAMRREKAKTAEEPPEEQDPDSPTGDDVEAELVAEQVDGETQEATTDEEKPVEETKKEEAPKDPLADNLVRLTEANRKLVEENEKLRAIRTAAPKPTLFDDAERHYYETDSITGIRYAIAAILGVEKPDDPKVDAELRDLYADLTAKELGVTPDPAHQAKREAARTRQAWEREKRQRTAKEQDKANEGAADADTKKAEAAAAWIAPRLQSKASDYPLLTNLAEVFDGMKPEALVWKVIERESKTGRLAVTADDDAVLAAAMKLVEEHYATLVDKVSKAKPQAPSKPPSTAKPTDKAAVPSASKENAPKPRGANLTTADASVAPTTPPAKKPQPTKNDTPPKFKNNEERKAWALRHLDK